MLLKNLINEYKLRNRAVRYKKLSKRFLYNRIEKNNYELLYSSILQLKTS